MGLEGITEDGEPVDTVVFIEAEFSSHKVIHHLFIQNMFIFRGEVAIRQFNIQIPLTFKLVLYNIAIMIYWKDAGY